MDFSGITLNEIFAEDVVVEEDPSAVEITQAQEKILNFYLSAFWGEFVDAFQKLRKKYGADALNQIIEGTLNPEDVEIGLRQD